MKHFITFFLLIALLISCVGLASCQGQDANPVETTTPTTVGGTEPPADEIYNPTSLDLPSDLKYDGDFKILTYQANVPEFCLADTANPDAIESSLRSRDLFITARLGLTVHYNVIPGGYGSHNDFSTTARISIEAGLKAYDMIAAYSLIPANLALNDVLTDMAESKYIDFDKTWYPQFMVDTCTINNQTYFITGDFSAASMFRMEGVAFNPVTAEQNGLSEKDLYQMVYDNTWTYDRFFSMCKDLGQGTPKGDDWSADDFYPIRCTDAASIDAFFHGAGLTTMIEEDDGTVTIQNDLLGETCQNLFKLVMDAKLVDRTFYNEENPSPITENKCIFAVTPLNNFRLHFAASPVALGVLPMPKWEEGPNTPYTTWVASHYQYCIPNDLDDTERSAAVLETMGYGGYTYVVPTLFTKTMKLQYSPNVDASNMFDIMRDTRAFSISAV